MHLHRRRAAARTMRLESTEMTTLLLNEPSPLASACCVASELHDRIANWVNERGAGGEVNR